ncbi:carotenoid-cleaving dioxygenase, mitochondrial-like isoform X4 [Narcine bancroftii]|uniref:carotenoid-cleaving dioxygenase, mitochondrial-like isoform X4 n=1 Tax=Narcine bancroftii TaxID=1343680 RepID=UPI0038316810
MIEKNQMSAVLIKFAESKGEKRGKEMENEYTATTAQTKRHVASASASDGEGYSNSGSMEKLVHDVNEIINTLLSTYSETQRRRIWEGCNRDNACTVLLNTIKEKKTYWDKSEVLLFTKDWSQCSSYRKKIDTHIESIFSQLLPTTKKRVTYYSRRKGLECVAPLFTTIDETPEPIAANVKGDIPKWLRGSLLRNGPGKYEFGNDRYNHLFDGMALMHQFKIDGGVITYMSKYLLSDSYLINSAHNRIIVSEFGTAAMPDPCKTLFERFTSRFEISHATDNCSVNFARYKGDYYASTETNFIHKVDPKTLETKEKINLTSFIAVNGATAHPHYDPDGTTYNMGNSFGKTGTMYNIIAVPPQMSDDEETLQGRIVCNFKPEDNTKPSYYHSFGMTKNYIIFVEQPVKINIIKILTSKLRGKSLDCSISWEPKLNTIIHVANKHTGEIIPFKYYTKAFCVFHHINAFEDNDFIIFDCCCFENGNILNNATLRNLREDGDELDEVFNLSPKGFPHRFVLPLNINSNTPIEQNLNTLEYSSALVFREADGKIWCESEKLFDEDLVNVNGMEFPQINYEKYNTKKYKFFYGCGTSHVIMDSLIKMDVETKKFKIWKEKGYYPSEPVFVPSPSSKNEDDGIILSVVISPNQSKNNMLLVLDAKSFTEMGRAEVPVRMPFGFHGVFAKC